MMGITDKLAAYQFDAAVTTFGSIIENAAQERVEVGSGSDRRWIPRYTLAQLLDDKFKLPQVGVNTESGDLSILRGADGGSWDEVGA